MPEKFELVEMTSKSTGLTWKVALACSLVIGVGLAVGLGVGLGVGLNKETLVYVTEPVVTTTKSGVITATTEHGSGGGDDSTPAPSTTTVPPSTTTVPPSTTTVPPSTTTVPPPIPDDGPWKNYRLPTNVIPTHYKLMLHPNVTTDTYTGTNAMSIVISSSTQYILVHVDSLLDITSTKLEIVNADETFDEVAIRNEFRYPEFEYYVVEAMNSLEGGDQEYLLTFGFKGSLIARIVGLYKSVYIDPNTGEEKSIVGSDMEPTDARKAYPCFDEPAMKINFTTTLVHEEHLTALSNMPVLENRTRSDGLVETTFQTSPRMSSYLGCFAISEFVYIEKMSRRGIPLRVYIPPHQREAKQADYALEVMKIVFDYFEELFDMPYTLPKCDMISIPNFGTGAMENWGLITYRETNLLWDPLESSTSNKQRVAAVVAHELVHQWYGNIVTMKWWDNIWLNEGFASYFEYFGQAAAEPTWQILDQFVTDDLQSTMLSDDAVTSRPIVSPVTTPSQITSVFDTLSYSKGASVLRYMHKVLGNDTFWGGMRYYLKKRAFSNANEIDLFGDFDEYAKSMSIDVNVTSLMLPWLQQMGFPVVTVKSSGEASQNHFLIDPTADLTARPISPYNYKWPINLTFITSNDSMGEGMLEIADPSISLDFEMLEEGDWVKMNPEQTGFYRVNYDDAMWETISNQLTSNRSAFTEIDRSNLIDDGFNLAPAELISYPKALSLTRYLDQEGSYFVWRAFSRGSSYIQSQLSTTAFYPDFTKYYLGKVKPIADFLGWNAGIGTHIEKLQRSLVLGLALSYGDQNAINNATDLFKSWIADESFYLFPDTRQLVYRYGIRDASIDDWNIMLERYVKESVATEKTNLLRGLTSKEDVTVINRMLEYSKNESIIKSQDFFTCITYISYTTLGNRMAWSWVQLNWEYMVDRFGITDRNFGRLVPNIVSGYNTEVQLWEVESFFAKYPVAGAGASGRVSAVNSIKTNMNWINKNQDIIGGWLKEELAS